MFSSFYNVEQFTQSIAFPFLLLCFSYPFFIWYLQSTTVNPKRYRKLEFCWNAFCSFFSLIGFLAIRQCPEILDHTVVDLDKVCYPAMNAISLFCLTKPLEFIDTIFLVLKKKPVSTLHLWHHFSVAIYCYFSVYRIVRFGHIFAYMNLFVHAIMYAYYALMTAKQFWISRFAIVVTCLQIAQMFVGTYVSAQGMHLSPTAYERWNAVGAIFMYTSYLYLFLQFFANRYKINLPYGKISAAYLATVFIC